MTTGEVHPFHSDLLSIGFRLTSEGRRNTLQYQMRATPYLTYWVHWDAETDEVIFTWELAVGEFMASHGLQIGTNETLNLFLFPQHDARGTPDVAFVAQELDRAEAVLRSVDLTAGPDAG